MVRKIEYELDDVGRVSPSTEQKAGVQGDHRATKLEFKIPISLIDNIEKEDGEELKYRFDVYTGAGTYKNYEEIDPSLETDGYLTVSLPLEEAVTRYGGKITVVLLIVGIRNDSTEHIVQSFPVQLKLAQKPSEGGLAGDSREELITILVKAEAAKEEALVYSENARTAADEAIEAKEEIESIHVVKKVNGNTPDDEGNVSLNANDIPFDDTNSVAYEVVNLKFFTSSELNRLRNNKQDKLIAGDNVTIVGNRISASGGGGAVNSVNGKTGDVTLTASDIEFSGGETVFGAISDVQGGLSILDNYVTNDLNPRTNYSVGRADDAYSMAGGAAIGVSELQTSKQDKLTAGDNITIEGNVISASGGGGGSVKTISTIANDASSTKVKLQPDEEGNIELPIANTAGTYGNVGLVKAYSGGGVTISSSGQYNGAIMTQAASMNQLNNRTAREADSYTVTPNDRAPIVPGTIDKAVRLALTDGRGRAYTNEEKLAALLRLGCTVDSNGFVKFTS